MIRCLLHRAWKLTSSWTHFYEECSNICDILRFNNYPTTFFEKSLHIFLAKINQQSSSVTDLQSSTHENNFIVKIPYIGKYSENLRKRIYRLFNECNISNTKLVFTTNRLQSLFRIKQIDSKFLTPKLVYEFTCSDDQSISYIGEPSRQLIRRIEEHCSDTASAIKNHLHVCSTCSIDTKSHFKILTRSNTAFELSIKEAILIKQNKPTLNTQQIRGRQAYLLKLF